MRISGGIVGKLAFGLGLAAALAGGEAAAQAAPWDGEWEGTLRHSDLACSPCKVRLTISNGLPNIRSSASIPSFTVSPQGEVVAEMPLQVAGNAGRTNCRLTGKAQSASIAAAGNCGNYSSQAELELKRISGAPPGSAVAALPANPQPSPPAAAPAAPARPAAPVPAAAADFGASAQAVRLGDMSFAMELGAEIGQFQSGNWLSGCGNGRTTPIKLTAAMRPNPATTRTEFDRSLREYGYRIGGAIDGTETPAAYLVIGRVTSMRTILCLRENTQPVQSSGSGSMTADWHVVAARSGETVYRFTTTGSYELPAAERKSNGITDIFAGTYRDMMRRLAADGGFRNAVSATPAAARSVSASSMAIRTTPRFTNGITANMDKILPSVVEVRRGGGIGAGFVIDARGYLLTNAHVVGAADTVTVRFNDGRSVDASVLRRDVLRDIALLKLERAGLRPIPIRLGKLTLTEKVFAIGNPLGLSQTVTDGIVSAYRQRPNDAQEYIQASVSITFGNSGGPLLDANGNVVGVSVATLGSGLNFFIPIESALQHLDLRL
jgi:S1-C subfamily serine protease